MDTDNISAALSRASGQLKVNLQTAKTVEKDVFVTKPGFYLGGAPFMIYYNLLNELGCGTFKEVDQLVSRSKCSDAEEALEDLWAIEDGWNTFLKSTEQEEDAKPAGAGDSLEPATLESIVLKRCSDEGELSLGSLIGEAEVTHFVLLRHLA